MAMVLAGYAVELIFGALLILVPGQRHARVEMAHISWDYTTYLNIGFGALSLVMLHRFFTTGGPHMLRMMSAPAKAHRSGHDHGHSPDHEHHR